MTFDTFEKLINCIKQNCRSKQYEQCHCRDNDTQRHPYRLLFYSKNNTSGNSRYKHYYCSRNHSNLLTEADNISLLSLLHGIPFGILKSSKFFEAWPVIYQQYIVIFDSCI